MPHIKALKDLNNESRNFAGWHGYGKSGRVGTRMAGSQLNVASKVEAQVKISFAARCA